MEKTILRSQLIARLDCYNSSARGYIESRAWLRDVVDVLDTLQDAQIHLILSKFSKLPQVTQRMRWELSRLPMLLKFDTQWLIERREFVLTPGIRWYNSFYTVGSPICPKDVFWDEAYREIRSGDYVWCFYSPKPSTDIDLPNVYTWGENDSIVDWVARFVEHPQTYGAAIMQRDDDVACVMTDTPLLNIEDRILIFIQHHFIQHNAPVSTQQILEQNYATPRHIHRVLRELVMADKIQRVSHGKYIIACEKSAVSAE